MRIRLQRGVILNDKGGKQLGDGNHPDTRDIEVDDKLGEQLLKGGSADLLDEVLKAEKERMEHQQVRDSDG